MSNRAKVAKKTSLPEIGSVIGWESLTEGPILYIVLTQDRHRLSLNNFVNNEIEYEFIEHDYLDMISGAGWIEFAEVYTEEASRAK